jgi:hypothetical protein
VNETTGDSGSTHTCLTRGLRVWVIVGMSTGTLKRTCRLPVLLPTTNDLILGHCWLSSVEWKIMNTLQHSIILNC